MRMLPSFFPSLPDWLCTPVAVLTEERLFNRLRVHFIEWVRADPSHPDRVAQAMASDARGDRTGAIRLLRDAMPVIDDGQAELVIDWLRGISL